MTATTARTIPQLLIERAALAPDMEAFRFPVGHTWETLTWHQLLERVRAAASGLVALGLRPGDCACILSSTRIEWVIADLAILCAGGTTAAAHATSPVEECTLIARDCDAVVAFAEDAVQATKLEPDARLRHVILLDAGRERNGRLTLAALEDLGREHDRQHPGALTARLAAVQPTDLASLLYTSGTSGDPRGVEITHEAWLAHAEAIAEAGLLADPSDLQFLFLPLAHSFGHSLVVAQLRLGFPTAIDGRRDHLASNLREVRPRFACVVPRVLDKVYARTVRTAEARGPVGGAVLSWALRVATRARQHPDDLGMLARLEFLLADRLVFARVRASLGGRLRFLICGAAPLSRDAAAFLEAAGIPVLEGYGLTETCSVTHCNRLWANRHGTVGRPLPGVQTRIAEDGEVLLKAPWLMRGYHNLPEPTLETIEDGWLHTGDIGRVEADGFLKIFDRKKDLIKTPAGEYVAPQQLEGRVKAACPLISEALIHMDVHGRLAALVTLNADAVSAWVSAHRQPGRKPSPSATTRSVQSAVETSVAELNSDLPGYATIERVVIAPNEFSEASGEVTPSLKLRRQRILDHHRPLLEATLATPMVSSAKSPDSRGANVGSGTVLPPRVSRSVPGTMPPERA